MKSKITKIQTMKKGIVLILMLAILLPSTIYAAEGLTLQASSALEKLMYGEVGSQVKKIEEHFKSNTTLYLTNQIQLRALAEYVNDGNSCYGKRIELLNNIEIDPDIDWTPIGNSYSEFSGTFDGNGYTINNLTYLCRENYVTEGGYSNVGLFGVVSINGTVEKVNVNNSNIQANELDTFKIFKVGNIAGENYGKVVDCTADVMPLNIEEVEEGTLVNGYIGLLVGMNNGSIENTKEVEPSTNLLLQDDVEINIDLSAYKDDEKIEDFTIPTYIKIGETLRLEFVIDTYLYTGLVDGQAIKLADNDKNKADIETYPLVTIGNCKFTPVEAIQEEVEIDENTTKPQTTLVYECTVTDEEDVKAENDAVCMNFEKNINEENLYVYYSEDSKDFFTGDKINKKAECSNLELNLDSKLPGVEVEVAMDEPSKSGRYAEGKELVIKVKTTEKIQATVAPELMISFSESGIGKYNYQEYYTKGNAVHVDAILDGEGKTTWIYSYIIQPGDEGILNVEYISGTLTDLVGNTVNIIAQANNIEEIYADTTAPKVQISAKNIENSITNKDIITYEFKWSEQIEDFTADDITINNGTKGELVKIYNITSNNIVANGDINGDTNITELDAAELEKLIDQNEEVDKKYDFNEDGVVNLEDSSAIADYAKDKLVEDKICKYTMDIATNVQNGSVGDLQVIIEDNACHDLVGHGNVRSESIIRVDKKAPELSALEAYVESEIKLNNQIDIVKEYYKTGEKITVVAIFDENVKAEKVPELILKFSESGNSVVPEGTIEGNKIVYTYIIADGDKGTVSVRTFNGTVSDAVGNSTNVTRKTLDGNTIIVDTDKPNVELNVITPEGTYGVGKEIIIEAKYDEEIFILDNNEIKLLDTKIEVETEDGEKVFTDNAPILKVEFTDGVEREAKVAGYGTKEDGSVDRTKIIYKYTIIPGDNGELSIVSYTNRENLEICDIAGNISNNQFDVKTYGVIADTIKPKVENITAIVTDPSVLNTEKYYKAGNEIDITVEFDEEVSGAVLFPEILIGFSEEEGKEPTEYNTYAYESDWNVNTTTIKYSYTIQDKENGYLWVKVPEGQFKDVAGNKNDTEGGIEVSTVFADTTAPHLAINENSESQWDINYVTNDDGQVTGIKAEGTFSEKIFSMENNRLIELKDLPEMGIFIDGELKKTVKVSSITNTENQTKLTYETNVTEEIDKSGILSVNLISGTVYDRAGNKWTLELEGDTSSPVFKDIKILTSNGFYKSEKVIEIIARFEEETKLAKIPTLKVKIGEKVVELEGTYYSEDSENTDNIKVARYAYEITDTDNGALNIISLIGEVSDGVRGRNISQIYIDTTNDEKDDVNGKPEELLNSYGNKYANNQEEYKNVIADNINPYVEKVEVYSKNELIAKYTKEDAEDAIIEVFKKTNANEVEYVITASEPINTFDNTKILITNGIINEEDITEISSTTIRVKANTTTEGVQSLIISNNAADDRAGNFNELERFNLVTTDFTKPTVRFISEYNGGVYVLPTNIGKVEIRPNVEISEDIAKIEYRWDDGEYVEIENYSTSSDISIPTKAFTEAGTYVLSIKVVDLAGNVTETSKRYEVKNSDIDIELSTDDYTNQDVTATVSFGEGLTDNRKVTFKAEGSNETLELNASGVNSNGGVEYTVEGNGTIYVEATDKVGNKVFTECKVEKIDKDAPEIELTLNGANLVIGTEKENAVIKTNVKVADNTNVTAKYAYLQEEIDIYNITEEQKAKISTDLVNEAKIENAVSTKDNTPYYLYIIAVDEAGNEAILKSNPFIILDTNERKEMVTVQDTEEPEIENIIVPDDGNDESTEPKMEEVIIAPEIEISKLIAFNQEGKHIDITYNNFDEGEEYLDIIKEKSITLTQEKDGNIDYEYYSYVEVNGATTITVKGYDACGNEVIATYEVTRDSIEGPEFEVIGNSENWTNQDVKLEVYSNDELLALTVNGESILSEDDNYSGNIVITENGEYTFVATDIYGNTSEKVIKVTKIDKVNPVISKVETSGKSTTITATDVVNEVEGSGISEYAITDTTENPIKWSESNVIKVTHDGVWYAWVKDNAGNISRAENAIVVDTTAPVITFNYTVSTITAGLPIEATILTNEEAIISYSWNNEEMVTSENYITNMKVTKDSKEVGKYTLYVKATDKAGNASSVQKLEFNVVHVEEIVKPEIIFEDTPIIQINGVKYVKVSTDMTTEVLTEKMNKEALCGKTPEYKGLTEDNKLKSGTEIILNNSTEYVVIVNGDVNCDGKVDFLGDIILANNGRIGVVNLNTIQKLAADVNNSGSIEFISDIVSMNNYRLGIINSL